MGKYNVIGYTNQIIGQVEASDAVEAWSKAGKEFDGQNILDIRPTIEKTGEELRKEVIHRRYIEAKERREYYDSLSDRELLESINSTIREYVPYPSDIPPREGEAKTIGRMCLEGVANWLVAWKKGIIGD